MKADQIYKNLKQEFLSNTSIKHKVFFSLIENNALFFKLYEHNLPNAQLRSLLLPYLYMYLRTLDDIVDGDRSLIDHTGDLKHDKKLSNDFLLRRIDYLEDPNQASDEQLDILLKEIFDITSRLNIDINDELMQMIRSLQFDLNRRSDIRNNELIISNYDDIDNYFFKHYFSVHKIGATVTNPDRTYNPISQNLGSARRIYFNLRDFNEDINAGLINIPLEDMTEYNISEQDILAIPTDLSSISICKKEGFNSQKLIYPESVKAWLDDQLKRALDHLGEYRQAAPLRTTSEILKELIYREDLSKLVFRGALEWPSHSYLKKLNKTQERKRKLL